MGKSAQPFDTAQMGKWVGRWQAGDQQGADDLLRAVGPRLEVLARQMLRGFPNVQGWVEVADVLQGGLMRLLHTLRVLRPTSCEEFFNLAAVHLRRELLDLARKFAGKDWVPLATADDQVGTQLPADLCPSADDLDLWCRFHLIVERLPVEERELVGLLFYHGWTQRRAAELFGVNERTIHRRWASACTNLRAALGGQFPPTES